MYRIVIGSAAGSVASINELESAKVAIYHFDDLDQVRSAFEQQGITAAFVFVAQSELFEALRTGVIDAIVTRTSQEAGEFQSISSHTLQLDASGLTHNGNSSDETVNGTSSADNINLEDGNDTFTSGGGSDVVDGGAGFDQVIVSANQSQTSVRNDNDGSFTVTIGSDVIDLKNVERLKLTDGSVALDLDGNAGQTYRLYQAAFDRTPDQAGLSHNVNLMDQGLSIFEMANAFIASQEFQNTYGSNINDTQFLTLLYQNVLNRAPDQVGLDGWLIRMGSGTERKEVLFGFSESTENKANVASAIDDGIWLV